MDNLRGIILLVFAMAAFAVEDLLIKSSASTMPIGQILMLIGAGGAIAFGIWVRATGQPLFSRNFFERTVMLRNLGELIGTLSFITAISISALSTSTAIFQATPLAMTLGAALFLKEPVGWRRWTAVFVGFIGVLLIIRPGSASFDPSSLFAIGAVIGLAMRDLVTRVVPKSVPTLALACYAFVSVGVAGAAWLVIGAEPFVPMTGRASLGIAAAVACAVFGYYALVMSMRLAEISAIMPFRYTRLIFAMIIGMTFFNERPDALTYLGAGIIITSGIYTFFRERKQRAPTLSTRNATR